jgi:stage V sporulation protein S
MARRDPPETSTSNLVQKILIGVKEDFTVCSRIQVFIAVEILVKGEKQEDVSMDVLKVSAKSSPNSVAGALAGVLRERGGAELQAIGAGAINQAVKAVAIARGFVAPSGVDLICIPAFTDVIIDGEERTAIKLIVQPR